MLKNLTIAGALLVGGLGLAGSAAADCQSGPIGVFDYDSLDVCVLESYGYDYPPYYSYDSITVASLNAYGYNANPYEYTYGSASLSQYSGTQNWGGGEETYGGTNGGVSLARYADGEYTALGASFGSYGYDGNGYDYNGFSAGVNYNVAGEYASIYYNQFNFNGQGCQESLYMYDSSGYNEIIPNQPCTVEVPAIPSLPPL